MTTNAFDRLNPHMTSDSRWSYEIDDNQFLYVDDTGFDKIAIRNDACMVFAGSGILIEAWKHWLYSRTLNWAAMPPTDAMLGSRRVTVSVCLATISDAKLWFDLGWNIEHEDGARFSGSGALPARECWSINKCAVTAIGSACKVDPYSGGETKCVAFGSRRNNLSPLTEQAAQLATVDEALKVRGFHMDIATKKVTPISQHEKSKEFLSAASNQQLVASAPIGSEVHWTDEKRAELYAALGRVFDEGRL